MPKIPSEWINEKKMNSSTIQTQCSECQCSTTKRTIFSYGWGDCYHVAYFHKSTKQNLTMLWCVVFRCDSHKIAIVSDLFQIADISVTCIFRLIVFDSILLATYILCLTYCRFVCSEFVMFTRIVDENDACALCFATNGNKWCIYSLCAKNQQHWMVLYFWWCRKLSIYFVRSTFWAEGYSQSWLNGMTFWKSQLYNINFLSLKY